MPFNDYLRNSILNYVFGGAAFTTPGTLYLGLSTTAIAENGTGITEPTGGGYAREPIANNKTDGWDTATGADNTVSNASEIAFTEASGAWGTLTHFFISDAATGGNILVSGTLTTPKAIAAGDLARFTAGSLGVGIDDAV